MCATVKILETSFLFDFKWYSRLYEAMKMWYAYLLSLTHRDTFLPFWRGKLEFACTIFVLFFSPFRFIRMTNFYGFRWLQKWTVWKKLTQNFLITAVKIGRRILRVFNKSSETQLAFGWFLFESIKNDDRSWWWIVPCLNNLFTNLTYHFCRFSCFLNITANNWFLANYESMINDY